MPPLVSSSSEPFKAVVLLKVKLALRARESSREIQRGRRASRRNAHHRGKGRVAEAVESIDAEVVLRQRLQAADCKRR